MTRFNSILIANRGEIACRIMRTAKALGYRCIAVYSDADASAPHVKMADEAVCIGASPVGESYLVADKIIQAAKATNAGAIHPGYGFLSENASFAKAVEDAGLTFIGPSAESIDLMGNKAEAKRRMIEAKVPCVPGYEGRDQSDAMLLTQAEKVGLPLMVKAAAGGGGKGMRLVNEAADLANAIKLARAEAESAFGSGELILEKAIIRPRHVEVQVFADELGNTVHLGERDCSVQRRHQKVVEEAPCPIMTEPLRLRMGTAAVEAATSIGYRGAGTVEFLLDESGEFYFLEMNTRLQVEHPVTELITGLDLVALQIRVAQGEPLGFSQAEVSLRGHAIEVRLYTEDTAQDFLPTSGPVDLWQPAQGEGIRIDSGIVTGQEISPYYDPMVAKIIASGSDRETARRRLVKALKETVFFGTKTNKAFLIDCLEKDTFIQGAATTAFISDEFSDAQLADAAPSLAECAAAAIIECELDYRANADAALIGSCNSANNSLKNWSSAGSLLYRKHYQFTDAEYDLAITPLRRESAGQNELAKYRVAQLNSDGAAVTLELTELDPEQCRAKLHISDAAGTIQTLHCQFRFTSGRLQVAIDGKSIDFIDQIRRAGAVDEAAGGGNVVAPMHGLLLDLKVSVGDTVTKGQTLCVLEAMKMHHEIQAQIDGTVSHIHIAVGDQVPTDALLIEITEALEAS